MIGLPRTWRRTTARILTGFAAPVLLSVTGEGRTAEPIAQPANVAPTEGPVVDLASFRATALEHSPVITAARASLAAAQARSQSLDSIRFGGILTAHDLPIRRQQAALGIQSYEAGLHNAEADTVYSVTWCYIAYLYAREQQDVVLRAQHGTADQLRNTVKKIVDEELQPQRRFVDRAHLNLIDAYTQTLEGRRQETLNGLDRALAALREAMGVGPEVDVRPTLKAMPLAAINVNTTREEVISLALARRGEIVQTQTFAEVTCLEITAQGRTFLPTLRTFAAGSDIHAQPVPTGSQGIDYKPGCARRDADNDGRPTPRPPGTGVRLSRPRRSRGRKDAQPHHAGGRERLLPLEGSQGEGEELEKAADNAEKYSAYVSKQFAEATEAKFVPKDPTKFPPDPRVPDVLNSEAVSLRMRIDANRAYFEYLLVLADLERITGGGFCIEFYPRPAA